MRYDEIFDTIDELYKKNNENQELAELVEDFYKAAFEYTKERVKWNFYTREEKSEFDNYRTSRHDSFIYHYNLLIRSLELTMDVSKLKIEGDRKMLGDFANYVVYRLAVKQR